MDEVEVRDNPAELQYEAWIGDAMPGFIRYRKAPGVLVFVHTDVDPDYEGHGVGSALVHAALDDVRNRGLSVAPTCPFVARYIAKHSEFHDLVVPDPG
jgi:predicted GNAT family acetyltransferase